jgi:hypothetical protein
MKTDAPALASDNNTSYGHSTENYGPEDSQDQYLADEDGTKYYR